VLYTHLVGSSILSPRTILVPYATRVGKPFSCGQPFLFSSLRRSSRYRSRFNYRPPLSVAGQIRITSINEAMSSDRSRSDSILFSKNESESGKSARRNS
jgi:hypothetical protein